MNELSLFSGAGGGLLAGRILGWNPVGYVEYDDYCQKVLRQRIKDGWLPDAPIFGDIRSFDARPYYGKVDIVTAGFPCPPFSVAGKQLGEKDPRNMWPDTIRIIREVRPRFVFLENVPGLLVSYMGTVLRELAESGYDVKWKVLSAAEVGAPHKRDRLFIVAYPHSGVAYEKQKFREGCKGKAHVNRNGSEEPMADSSGKGLEGLKLPSGASQKHTTISDSCWWASEPDVGRVAHGVASRVDRLKAIGNGIVPQCMVKAWEILTND